MKNIIVYLYLINYVNCFLIDIKQITKFRSFTKLFSNTNDLISISNNFDDFITSLPGKNNLNNNRIIHPYEIINNIKEEGTYWSYSELINNIKSKDVDAVLISNDCDHIEAIDIFHNNVIQSNNIHYVKILSNNIDFLINLLIHNNVNFEIY